MLCDLEIVISCVPCSVVVVLWFWGCLVVSEEMVETDDMNTFRDLEKMIATGGWRPPAMTITSFKD